MNDRSVKIESRNETFTKRVKSEITQELPASDNCFLARKMRVRGYDVLELMEKYSYEDVFLLLFLGELPDKKQKALFRILSVFLINLGPRHQSSRAAANAGVGRTDPTHIVPIASMAASGTYNGAKEVENAMWFLKQSISLEPGVVAKDSLAKYCGSEDTDKIINPGFGSDFGGQSPFLLEVCQKVINIAPKEGYLCWANGYAKEISINQNCGWRTAGLVAAVLLDLGFNPREGGGVFQILSSPGALVHGVSFANKPITEIPFLEDKFYEIKNT